MFNIGFLSCVLDVFVTLTTSYSGNGLLGNSTKYLLCNATDNSIKVLNKDFSLVSSYAETATGMCIQGGNVYACSSAGTLYKVAIDGSVATVSSGLGFLAYISPLGNGNLLVTAGGFTRSAYEYTQNLVLVGAVFSFGAGSGFRNVVRRSDGRYVFWISATSNLYIYNSNGTLYRTSGLTASGSITQSCDIFVYGNSLYYTKDGVSPARIDDVLGDSVLTSKPIATGKSYLHNSSKIIYPTATGFTVLNMADESSIDYATTGSAKCVFYIDGNVILLYELSNLAYPLTI